jgi:hypothetical protein
VRIVAALLLVGCGGIVTFTEPDGGSGGGTSSSTSSGPSVRCEQHSDCAEDELCVFATGTCHPSCAPETCDSCGSGLVCDTCATSGCPDCLDCRGACLPVGPDQCDADDACGVEEACDFLTNRCEPTCESSACADPNLVCQPCGTSSCCACKDCVAICLPL